MGVYSFTAASGASIGLIFGGVITQTVGWHWAFLINVPIGLLSLAFAVRVLAGEQGTGLGNGADVLGAVLVTAGLSLGVYTIVQTAEPHASLLRTLVLAVVSVLLLAAFVLRQARIASPTKRWKLSPMDLESRARWVDYSRAKDDMFHHTDTERSHTS